MRNIKTEKKMAGHEFWPAVAIVKVKGDPTAKKFPEEKAQPERETVVQTWQKVAVLKVTPKIPFKVGYIHGRAVHFLNVPVETEDGAFGMRIGDDDVEFFVLPVDLSTELKLEVVEETVENNPKYRNLPLY